MQVEVHDSNVQNQLVRLRNELEGAFSLRKEIDSSACCWSIGRFWLIPSIRRDISRYGIRDLDEWAVLVEAYFRAFDFICRGGEIFNLVPWLKGASVRIIYEHLRKSRPTDTLYFSDLERVMDWEYIPSSETLDLEGLVDRLWECMNSLPQCERELILWKSDGLSWVKIRQKLIDRGESPPSESTLRKRKERAVLALRKLFFDGGRDIHTVKNLSEQEYDILQRSFSHLKTSKGVIK